MKTPSDMNEDTTPAGDDVGALIRNAGARLSVAPERAARARERVHTHWQGVVAEERNFRRQRSVRGFSMAAGVILMLSIAYVVMRAPEPAASISLAGVERVLGTATVGGQPLKSDSAVRPGDELVTGPAGRLALRLTGGQSMRIDASTRLTMIASNRVRLDSGAVYVDTGSAAGQAVEVETEFGVARDIGTQFQLRIRDDALTIGVREGEVELIRGSGDGLFVDSGFFVDVPANGEESRTPVAASDERWHWASDVAPAFDTDGATLHEFLSWYAREQGLKLTWQNDSEETARTIRISGTIHGDTPDDALEQVRLTTPFESLRSGDELTVTVQ